MNARKRLIHLLLIGVTLTLFLSSCQKGSGITGSQTLSPPETTAKVSATATALPPSSTAVPTLSVTVTPGITKLPQLPTLVPTEAAARITELLKTNGGCKFPCWWGITPGETMLEEAGGIFSHLGLPMSSTTFEGKDFSGIHFVFDSGLSIRATLTIQDKVVENIQLQIIPEKQEAGIQREWSAYSPETLIERYGPPTRVDFLADWGPGPFFSIQMYYDAFDLIAQYAGDNIIPPKRGESLICPLSAQFDSVWLWLGENPAYPPGPGIPLDEVTSLTVDEFAQLMIGDPDAACFMFDGNTYKSER